MTFFSFEATAAAVAASAAGAPAAANGVASSGPTVVSVLSAFVTSWRRVEFAILVANVVFSSTFLTFLAVAVVVNKELRRYCILSLGWVFWLTVPTIFLAIRLIVGMYHFGHIIFDLACFAGVKGVARAYRSVICCTWAGGASTSGVLGEDARGGTGVGVSAALHAAPDYAAWQRIAAVADERSGAAAWRAAPGAGDVVEWRALRAQTQRLAAARRRQDVPELLFLLRLSCSRHYCGVSAPELYTRALCGTKREIEEFTREICDAVAIVEEAAVEAIEKLAAAPRGVAAVRRCCHALQKGAPALLPDVTAFAVGAAATGGKARAAAAAAASLGAGAFASGYRLKFEPGGSCLVREVAVQTGSPRESVSAASTVADIAELAAAGGGGHRSPEDVRHSHRRKRRPHSLDGLRSAGGGAGAGANSTACGSASDVADGGAGSVAGRVPSNRDSSPAGAETAASHSSREKSSANPDGKPKAAAAEDGASVSGRGSRGNGSLGGGSPAACAPGTAFSPATAGLQVASAAIRRSCSEGAAASAGRVALLRVPRTEGGAAGPSPPQSSAPTDHRLPPPAGGSFPGAQPNAGTRDEKTPQRVAADVGATSAVGSSCGAKFMAEVSPPLATGATTLPAGCRARGGLRWPPGTGAAAGSFSAEQPAVAVPTVSPVPPLGERLRPPLPAAAAAASGAAPFPAPPGPPPTDKVESLRTSVDEVVKMLLTMRLSYGRTALCLSGGGSLAMYHMGVVKALLEIGALPRVISGTSGGSIVAGVVAIYRDDELLSDMLRPEVVHRYPDYRWFPPLSTQVRSFLATGRMMDGRQFERTCKAYFGDFTFREAFQRTGRLVSIVVAPAGASRTREATILNHVNSPDVFIWSAVCASCALPGLLPAHELLVRAIDGRPAPFCSPGSRPGSGGLKWVDGSLQQDIPMRELACLFNVKQFIVSQVNPHLAPFVQEDVAPPPGGLHALFASLEKWLTLDIKNRYAKLAKFNMVPKIFGQHMANFWMAQTFEGNITITPRVSLLDWYRMVSQPTEEDMQDFIRTGETRTWPHCARISQALRIELALRRAWARLAARLETAAAASDSPSSRHTAAPTVHCEVLDGTQTDEWQKSDDDCAFRWTP